MKNIGNYVFWTLFLIGVFAFVYLVMAIFGAATGYAEAGALGITFGITADILILNSSNETKDAIREFFRIRI